MIDATPNQRAAITYGGKMGGEILDEIGKTDLAELSKDQWHTFLTAVIDGYIEHLQSLNNKDKETLDRTRSPF